MDGKYLESILLGRQLLNVYPTDYCNQRCVFCKMTGLLGDERTRRDMSLADLRRVISFCKRSGIQGMRILGGEPSNHPLINAIIDEIYASGMYVAIFFTNGLFDNRRLIDQLVRRAIPVNFHYFPRHEYASRAQYAVATGNLKRLFTRDDQRRVGTRFLPSAVRSMSIIFYQPGQDYDYILKAGRRYGVDEITWSLAHSSIRGDNRHVRWEQIKAMVPTMMRFIRDAAAAGMETSLECPLTPCVFSRGQLRYLRRFVKDLSFRCEPILDVFPDLTVHYCMGMPIVSRITPTNTARDILLEQLRRSEPIRSRPRSRACLSCEWREKGYCQGYCLQYKYDLNDKGDRVLLNGLDWYEAYRGSR